jgi:hypothetical protein
MLLAGVMSQAADALGDVIIFHDLTDTITVEHIGSADTATVSCPTTEGTEVVCEVVLSRAGAIPHAGSGSVTIAEDATLQLASDQYQAGGSIGGQGFELLFTSLADGTALSCAAAFGLGLDCSSFETGAVQTAGTLTWTSGPDDTIQFQSDISEVAAVPEPASALLLATTCGILLPFVRRRRQRTA